MLHDRPCPADVASDGSTLGDFGADERGFGLLSADFCQDLAPASRKLAWNTFQTLATTPNVAPSSPPPLAVCDSLLRPEVADENYPNCDCSYRIVADGEPCFNVDNPEAMVNNFCCYTPDERPGCTMWEPAGYCQNPGDDIGPSFQRGFFEFKRLCPPPDVQGSIDERFRTFAALDRFEALGEASASFNFGYFVDLILDLFGLALEVEATVDNDTATQRLRYRPFVDLLVGADYELSAQIKKENVDNPRVHLEYYDDAFRLLGTAETLEAKSGKSGWNEVRTIVTVRPPSTAAPCATAAWCSKPRTRSASSTRSRPPRARPVSTTSTSAPTSPRRETGR